MNKSLIGIFLVFLTAPLFASDWVCTYKSNSLKVSLDETTRLMRVVLPEGTSDEGLAVRHEDPRSNFIEYRMGVAPDDYAYYFYLGRTAATKPEFRYCSFCESWPCEPAHK